MVSDLAVGFAQTHLSKNCACIAGADEDVARLPSHMHGQGNIDGFRSSVCLVRFIQQEVTHERPSVVHCCLHSIRAAVCCNLGCFCRSVLVKAFLWLWSRLLIRYFDRHMHHLEHFPPEL